MKEILDNIKYCSNEILKITKSIRINEMVLSILCSVGNLENELPDPNVKPPTFQTVTEGFNPDKKEDKDNE